MYRKLVFCLLLLCGSAVGQPSAPVAIGNSGDGHPLLGVPRYRGGQQGDTLIIMSAQQGTNQTGWMVSYDRGNNWQSVAARWQATGTGQGTWYSSDHSAAWFAGGLHIAYRSYSSGDPFGYRYVAAPYASESDMETARVPAPGTDTYMPMVVANNANDVWVIDQNEGGSRDNLRYWHSTDRFATAATVGRICNVPEDPQNNWRVGAIMGADGYPKVSVFHFTKGFVIWEYNGSTWDSVLVHAASLGALARFYCHTEVNGLNHVAYTGSLTGPLVHFWETSPGVFDSTIVSNISNGRIAPQFCVHGTGANARLYCVYYTGSSAEVKSWSAASGWDNSATQVSGSGHNPPDPAMIPTIPATWDFIPIWYTAGNTIYYVKLNVSPISGQIDTIPPAPVNDLGATTGDDHGTIRLDWSAPGDDQFIGAADTYLIRYSSDPITAGNWDSATPVGNPPTPTTAGSSQQLVVANLTPDALYYVAMKARDDAFNVSDMSNVDSARAFLDLALDVEDENPLGLPTSHVLKQNYPNPFNPITHIEYSLPTAAFVELNVFNVTGRVVTTLVDQQQAAGSHWATWDGTDYDGRPVASGIYFYLLSTPDFHQARKMVLVR